MHGDSPCTSTHACAQHENLGTKRIHSHILLQKPDSGHVFVASVTVTVYIIQPTLMYEA